MRHMYIFGIVRYRRRLYFDDLARTRCEVMRGKLSRKSLRCVGNGKNLYRLNLSVRLSNVPKAVTFRALTIRVFDVNRIFVPVDVPCATSRSYWKRINFPWNFVTTPCNAFLSFLIDTTGSKSEVRNLYSSNFLWSDRSHILLRQLRSQTRRFISGPLTKLAIKKIDSLLPPNFRARNHKRVWNESTGCPWRRDLTALECNRSRLIRVPLAQNTDTQSRSRVKSPDEKEREGSREKWRTPIGLQNSSRILSLANAGYRRRARRRQARHPAQPVRSYRSIDSERERDARGESARASKAA